MQPSPEDSSPTAPRILRTYLFEGLDEDATTAQDARRAGDDLRAAAFQESQDQELERWDGLS